jgi:hypothetical protein
VRTHGDLNIYPPGAYVLQTSKFRLNEGCLAEALCRSSFYSEFISGRRLDHRERLRTNGALNISPLGPYALQRSRFRLNDGRRVKALRGPSFYIAFSSVRRLDHGE